MRVFLALELGEDLRAGVEALLRELGPRLRQARWVPPENVHLTLRFLGETSEEVVRGLVERLRPALDGVPPFAVTFAGLGVFPDPRRPRVLWVGVPSPPPALFEAQSAIERAVREAGLSPERRPFEPHLTVARFRRPERRVGAVLDAFPTDRVLGTLDVSEVTCFESELGREKASYRPLAKLPLAAG